MTSQLTQAILFALLEQRVHGLTALGVTFAVRKRIPHTPHTTVKAELERMIERGSIVELRKPYLPTRYKYRSKIKGIAL